MKCAGKTFFKKPKYNEGVYEGLFLQTFVKRTVINKKHPTFLPSVNPKILSKEWKLLLSVGN